MKPNTNPKTGVAFGYVAANDLDGEVVHELMYGAQARNLTRLALEAEEVSTQMGHWQERCDEQATEAAAQGTDYVPEEFKFDEYQLDGVEEFEPTVEGICQNVHYISSWLGGALNFFITDSPVMTRNAHLASPCVPNAGILKNDFEGNVTCYTVPDDWWPESATEPAVPQAAKRGLLDTDGENRAVRSFLLQYSCDRSITVGAMRKHMDMSGWPLQYCPEFARTGAADGQHLTKAGAQLWIRHLFNLEKP